MRTEQQLIFQIRYVLNTLLDLHVHALDYPFQNHLQSLLQLDVN